MEQEAKELVDDIKKEKAEEVKEQKKDLVSKANEAADRLEKANVELTRLLEKQEILMANSRLGGKSFAGDIPVMKTEQDKIKEECMQILKGTGLNPFR